MPMPRPDHPVQTLLLFVASEFESSDVLKIEQLIEDLAATREWVIHPPVFVNEEDDEFPTLGTYLSLYSAFPPETLPLDLERRTFEEVKELVARIQSLSKESGLDFEVTLDGEDIGSIEGGESDRLLRVGLLEEWQRVLIEREGTK
jgi:hypothetical protein